MSVAVESRLADLARRNVRQSLRLGLAWISSRPAVLAAAAGLSLIALLHFDIGARGLIAAFFLAVLVVLSAIDIEERRIPNVIVIPSAAIVLAAQIASAQERTAEWTLASLGASLTLLLLALLYPAGMGMGDVKLALLLGAALGAAVVTALFLAFVAAAIAGLALIISRGLAARKTALPFGPFLALGAAVALFLGG